MAASEVERLGFGPHALTMVQTSSRTTAIARHLDAQPRRLRAAGRVRPYTSYAGCRYILLV